jgi:hypothetical protein
VSHCCTTRAVWQSHVFLLGLANQCMHLLRRAQQRCCHSLSNFLHKGTWQALETPDERRMEGAPDPGDGLVPNGSRNRPLDPCGIELIKGHGKAIHHRHKVLRRRAGGAPKCCERVRSRPLGARSENRYRVAARKRILEMSENAERRLSLIIALIALSTAMVSLGATLVHLGIL